MRCRAIACCGRGVSSGKSVVGRLRRASAVAGFAGGPTDVAGGGGADGEGEGRPGKEGAHGEGVVGEELKEKKGNI